MVGALFLTATFTYALGDALVYSVLNSPDYLLQLHPNRSRIVAGTLVQFVTATANLAIGILLLPIWLFIKGFNTSSYPCTKVTAS